MGLYDQKRIPKGSNPSAHASRSYTFAPLTVLGTQENVDIRTGKEMYRNVFIVSSFLTIAVSAIAFRKMKKK